MPLRSPWISLKQPGVVFWGSFCVPEWGSVTISNDKIRFAETTQAYDAWWHWYRKRKWGKGLSVSAVRFGREESVR